MGWVLSLFADDFSALVFVPYCSLQESGQEGHVAIITHNENLCLVNDSCVVDALCVFKRSIQFVFLQNLQIKKIDLPSKTCQTIELDRRKGSRVERRLNEPGGVCMHPNEPHLYIADTNNHSIVILNLETNILSLASYFPV